MSTETIKSPYKIVVGFTVVLLVLVGGYFAFRRTLVADALEALARPDKTDLAAYGATLFQTRGCTGCHSFAPAGSVADEGPDLTGIATRHDAAFIRTSIVDPNAVIAADCPEGPCQANVMPQWGSILTTEQVDALVTYLSIQ